MESASKTTHMKHVNSRMNSFLHSACEEALNQARIKFKEDDVVGLNIGTMSSSMSKITEFISAAATQGPEMINRLSMLHILSNIPGSTLAVKYRLKGPISTTRRRLCYWSRCNW